MRLCQDSMNPPRQAGLGYERLECVMLAGPAPQRCGDELVVTIGAQHQGCPWARTASRACRSRRRLPLAA